MLGSCLWRAYVPAGETYWLCSLFAPVRELAGGCSWKQEDETCTTTTSYATTLESHPTDLCYHANQFPPTVWPKAEGYLPFSPLEERLLVRSLLCHVTCDDEHQPLPTTRNIEPHFPNNQHRPSIITIGLDVPTISSVQKPRWNLRKANWPEFGKSIAESINRIPPRSENYQRFCKLF